MPSTQELLNLITGMQQQAQQNLPVIPNNGNPNGAYNVSPHRPQVPSPTPSPISRGPKYPWLDPSPSMANIDNLLAQPLMPPRMGFGNEQPIPMPTPVSQVPLPTKQVGGPTMGFNDGNMLPQLPRGTLRQQALQQEPPIPNRMGGVGFGPMRRY
jgi:hypothetical protein